jgi:hypothetical protein
MTSLARMATRPRTLIGLVLWTVLCELVAAPTKDKPGVEGVVSWIAWLGFWVGLLSLLVLGATLLFRRFVPTRP